MQVTPDERMSIKQVLGHPWLAEERAQDPHPIDTAEAALLFPIPRSPGAQPPLQVQVRIMEFPYLRDPECTIVASSYRNGTADVRLGCVRTCVRGRSGRRRDNHSSFISTP